MANFSSSQPIALVTGASSGIGKSTALQLHKAGYIVYAAARRRSKMDDLRAMGIQTVALDVTNATQAQAVVSDIIKEHDHIDVLLNIAGMGVFGSVEETALEDARYQMEVNLISMGSLIQCVVPHMRERRAGTIVNIASMVGKIPVPLAAWYVASKHAVEGFSDCLRIELAPFGIKVIIIEPGVINTGFGSVMQDPFLKRSGHGPYKMFLEKPAPKEQKEEASGSDPALVAQTIVQALQSDEPQTRYVVGEYADELLALRKKVSDLEMDKIVLEKF